MTELFVAILENFRQCRSSAKVSTKLHSLKLDDLSSIDLSDLKLDDDTDSVKDRCEHIYSLFENKPVPPLDPAGWNFSAEGVLVGGHPRCKRGDCAHFKHSQAVAPGDVFRMQVEKATGNVGFAGDHFVKDREVCENTVWVELDDGTTSIDSGLSLNGQDHWHPEHLASHIPKIKPYSLALRIHKNANTPQIQFNEDGVWHDLSPNGAGLKTRPWFPYLMLDEEDCLVNHRVDRLLPIKKNGISRDDTSKLLQLMGWLPTIADATSLLTDSGSQDVIAKSNIDKYIDENINKFDFYRGAQQKQAEQANRPCVHQIEFFSLGRGAVKSTDIVSDWVFWYGIPQEEKYAGIRVLAFCIALCATLIDVFRGGLRVCTAPKDKSTWAKVVNEDQPWLDQPGWIFGALHARLGFADLFFDDFGSLIACIWLYGIEDNEVSSFVVFNLAATAANIVIDFYHHLKALREMAATFFGGRQQYRLKSLISRAEEAVVESPEAKLRLISLRDEIKSFRKIRLYEENDSLLLQLEEQVDRLQDRHDLQLLLELAQLASIADLVDALIIFPLNETMIAVFAQTQVAADRLGRIFHINQHLFAHIPLYQLSIINKMKSEAASAIRKADTEVESDNSADESSDDSSDDSSDVLEQYLLLKKDSVALQETLVAGKSNNQSAFDNLLEDLKTLQPKIQGNLIRRRSQQVTDAIQDLSEFAIRTAALMSSDASALLTLLIDEYAEIEASLFSENIQRFAIFKKDMRRLKVAVRQAQVAEQAEQIEDLCVQACGGVGESTEGQSRLNDVLRTANRLRSDGLFKENKSLEVLPFLEPLIDGLRLAIRVAEQAEDVKALRDEALRPVSDSDEGQLRLERLTEQHTRISNDRVSKDSMLLFQLQFQRELRIKLLKTLRPQHQHTLRSFLHGPSSGGELLAQRLNEGKAAIDTLTERLDLVHPART